MIEPGAHVGERTFVWDYAHIRDGAQIGDQCVIGRGVFVDAGVILGSRCKVQNNALLYAPAVLEDGVFIGPGAILTNDRYPRAITPEGMPKSADDWNRAGVHVEAGAAVGAGSVVISGVRIGQWAMIAAGSTVIRDVPAYALVAGVPGRRIGWVGPAGHSLQANNRSWQCPVTGERFIEHNERLTPE